MRLIRPSILAAACLALAGCSLPSHTAAPAPVTVTVTATPETPSATPDTDDTTAAAPPSTATTPGTSAPSSTATTASAVPTASAGGHVVRYTDKTGLLQLPVSNAAIPDAPAGMRDYARAQLRTMWHDQFQSAPGCEGIAQLQLKRVSPTAAYVVASWGDTTPTCPQYAGDPGWWEVWGADPGQPGAWHTTLKGQGLAACSDLVSAGIPRAIYPSCSNGTSKVPNPVA